MMRTFFPFLMLLLLAGFKTHAETIHTVSSGQWGDPAVWSTGSVPLPSDDVVIHNGHTIGTSLLPAGGTTVLCHGLTVEQDGVLQLGHDGASARTFRLTGNIHCDGTISAGRVVPLLSDGVEGLIYAHNSSLELALQPTTTSVTGRGYLHPEHLLLSNAGGGRSVLIEIDNLLTDGDLLATGSGSTTVEVGHYSYLNIKGTLGIAGKDWATAPTGLAGSLLMRGVALCGNVSLFTRNPSVGSRIHVTGEGVLTANQLNGGAPSPSAAGGFELEVDGEAIFRCGEGVPSPLSLATAGSNLQVMASGRIKMHYSDNLTAGSEVLLRASAFDNEDPAKVVPVKEIMGATHIAGWYNFTDQPFMQEGVARFKEWGSTNIKTTVTANNGAMADAYPFNHNWAASYAEPAEVIADPYLDVLFADPYFTRHAFWLLSKDVNGYYKSGPDRNHQQYLETEEQVYHAAKELLTRYGHLNKTFVFQNWEGDWMLRGNNRAWEEQPETIPADVAWQVEGMARMWRAHMRGIERAVAENPSAVAKIEYAVEFNKLWRNVNGRRVTMMELGVPCVAADVLPKARMHLSSWSSYDGNFEEADRPYPTGLWNGLEMAAYYTNDTKATGKFPVQIGEIGINENPPFKGLSDEEIRRRYDLVVGMASDLGLPSIYLWNLYGSGAQSVPLVKGVQYSTDYLYQVLDGKWVFEPDGSLGLAAGHLKENYFVENGNGFPVALSALGNLDLEAGFGTVAVGLSDVFSDPDGDALTFSAFVEGGGVSATLSGDSLLLEEAGFGAATVSVTANDGRGGRKTVSFGVKVSPSAGVSVSIGDVFYPSIKQALLAAVDGDVIEVRGAHTEKITIQKNVTIRGADPQKDMIQAAIDPGVATGSVVNINRAAGFTGDLTVTLENLGIRNGNTDQNGGGIDIDRATGIVTLRNLIIENNVALQNGGGLSVAGSNVDIIDCTIRNNTALLDGGGAILAPNNGVSINNTVKIVRSLIDGNTGRNGGGLYINGNKGFGDNNQIFVLIENTTIANNASISPSTGNGGGAIWSKAAFWKGDGTTGNITLRLVHATLYNNTHTSALKNGINFSSDPVGALTNFSLYNSVVVTADDVIEKALNFANSRTTDVINCILGGLNAAPVLLDHVAKNNEKGRTASFAGLATTLSNEGGKVAVLALSAGARAINYCTAPINITLPTVDARNGLRDANRDAGAYEFGAFFNSAPIVAQQIEDQHLGTGFGTATFDLNNAFTDPNADALALLVAVSDETVVTASINNKILTINEIGIGAAKITLTATDPFGEKASQFFMVTVKDTEAPVFAPIENIRTGTDNGLCSATVAFAASVSDNYDATVTPIFTLANGTPIVSPYTFASGSTTVLVSATDAAGNTAETVSFQVEVVNTAPVISNIASPIIPVSVGTSVNASFEYADNNATKATFFWGDGNSSVVSPIAGGTVADAYTYAAPGVYNLTVTLEDACGEVVSQVHDQFVVVYDPSAGFVTGGGWILSPEGASVNYPDAVGKANFGFVSKYKKGATVPEGNTEFQFKAGGIDFKSSVYEWLVVAGNKAKFKGTGTINGLGDYGFMLTATDASSDLFRILSPSQGLHWIPLMKY